MWAQSWAVLAPDGHDRAFDVLPQDPYGEVVFTVHNGEYLTVPVCEGGLVLELRDRGYPVTHDGALINLIDGFSLGPVAG